MLAEFVSRTQNMTLLNSLPLRALFAAALLLSAVALHHRRGCRDGRWRVTIGIPAPWLPVVAKADTRAWVGEELRFGARSLRGPGVLSCRDAQYEMVSVPAGELFQGKLPAPAAVSAERLGIGRTPLPGLRVRCDGSILDFHRVDADTMLIAVDDVIWTLDRSPGARAPATSAEGTVQSMLQSHFAGSMEFVPASVQAKRAWLSAGLLARLEAYFAKAVPVNEPPLVNGDPFTDSQEYPTRFSVGAATVENDRATVIVRFADAHRERMVRYRLVRSEGGWRVDDLNYADGNALSVRLR
jgi:hypothetical protein